MSQSQLEKIIVQHLRHHLGVDRKTQFLDPVVEQGSGKEKYSGITIRLLYLHSGRYNSMTLVAQTSA